MTGLIRFIFSPLFLLALVGLSYFGLLVLEYIADQSVASDLWILGLVTACLVGLLIPFKTIKVDLLKLTADRLLKIIAVFFVFISCYLLLYFNGEIYQLLDNRFSIPGFGPISSLYAVGTVVGYTALFQSKSGRLRLVFIALSLFLGFVIGGKGFLVYIAFAYGFSLRAQISKKVNIIYLFLFIFFLLGSLFIGFANTSQDNDSIGEKILLRILFASDSIAWLGQMSLNEIHNFSITTITFLADLFLRFFGMRINRFSVGAEMANVVSGAENGSGPNATLPVMTYLLNQGNIFTSIIFLIASFILINRFLHFALKMSRFKKDTDILFAAAIFLSPAFVIDAMVYFQYLFWLFIIGIVLTVTNKYGKLLCG